MENENVKVSPRRKFLGSIAAGAATLGLASLVNPLSATASPLVSEGTDHSNLSAADAWFDKING